MTPPPHTILISLGSSGVAQTIPAIIVVALLLVAFGGFIYLCAFAPLFYKDAPPEMGVIVGPEGRTETSKRQNVNTSKDGMGGIRVDVTIDPAIPSTLGWEAP